MQGSTGVQPRFHQSLPEFCGLFGFLFLWQMRVEPHAVGDIINTHKFFVKTHKITFLQAWNPEATCQVQRFWEICGDTAW